MNITKEYCKSVFLNDKGKLIPTRTTEKYLRNHNLYDFVTSYYADSKSLSESIYRICFDIDVRPTCKVCGGEVSYTIGNFSTFCSKKCVNSDPEVLQKNKEGVSRSLKEAYKERGESIKKKRTTTLKKKYNIEDNITSPFSIKEIQEKAKEKIVEHYGVDNVFRLAEFHTNRDDWQKKSVEYQKTRGYDIEYVKNEIGDYEILVHNGCNKHGDIVVPLSVFNNRTRDDRKDYTVLCLDCNPLRSQTTSIENVIKIIFDRLNVKYIQHDRTEIKPYELDFYIPEHKIAIECNGIFWHSGEKNKNSHYNKYNYCKNKGIQLITFWEDTILNKTEIVESYIKTLLGLNERVFARNCVVREVSSKESNDFINKNHLQGSVNASIRIGLYYNDELVHIMTFGKLRKCIGTKSVDGEYELYRMCSKQGITVVGGASKILKYFINKYNPTKTITYSSNDIGNGDVYLKLGFSFVKETGPGFCYINSRTTERKNRFVLRKDRIDDGSGRSADKILESLNWLKCYDSGNKKFELITNNIN